MFVSLICGRLKTQPGEKIVFSDGACVLVRSRLVYKQRRRWTEIVRFRVKRRDQGDLTIEAARQEARQDEGEYYYWPLLLGQDGYAGVSNLCKHSWAICGHRICIDGLEAFR